MKFLIVYSILPLTTVILFLCSVLVDFDLKKACLYLLFLIGCFFFWKSTNTKALVKLFFKDHVIGDLEEIRDYCVTSFIKFFSVKFLVFSILLIFISIFNFKDGHYIWGIITIIFMIPSVAYCIILLFILNKIKKDISNKKGLFFKLKKSDRSLDYSLLEDNLDDNANASILVKKGLEKYTKDNPEIKYINGIWLTESTYRIIEAFYDNSTEKERKRMSLGEIQDEFKKYSELSFNEFEACMVKKIFDAIDSGHGFS